ncbi:Thyroglobulin [Cricetulus griseus]|uniref:Thyroglobulin n=1 Tax=Cricetulus griseus TaxID=10029 RepID=G3IM61_CRIGR|nr:Thyroglobulin [Cricetulus griseus]
MAQGSCWCVLDNGEEVPGTRVEGTQPACERPQPWQMMKTQAHFQLLLPPGKMCSTDYSGLLLAFQVFILDELATRGFCQIWGSTVRQALPVTIKQVLTLTSPVFVPLVKCPEGSFSQDGRCNPCPVGTYQEQAGSSTCIPCPRGRTTIATGAFSKAHYCADDKACSFLTVSTMGPEVSCDFYSWTRDNFACMTFDQVSCNSCRQLYSFATMSDMPVCSGGLMSLKIVKVVSPGIAAAARKD